MTETPGRPAPAPASRPRDASEDGDLDAMRGWAAIAGQIEADLRFRDALAGTGADLQPATLALLARLHAVRARLQGLRDAAQAAARLGTKASRGRGGAR